MNPRPIAPAIARWGIIPSVGGFVALGVFILSLPFRDENRDDVWIAFSGAGLLAAFLFYVAYRGFVLIRFRNVRADMDEGELVVDHKGRQVTYCLHGLEVRDFPHMQIVEVRERRTGEKVLAVDYCYPFGMELVRRLKKGIGEQAEDGGPSQQPC